MQTKRWLPFIILVLATAFLAELSRDLLAQRRGGLNRGSTSRYRGGGNFNRGSINSYSRAGSRGSRENPFANLQPRSSGTQFDQRDRNAAQRQQVSRDQLRQDGTTSRDLRGGGNVTSTKTTSGDTSARNTTVTTGDGRTATGTRTTQRSGDEIKTESNIRSSTGASRQAKTEVEFDDGRIDKVKRDVETRDRSGFETERGLEAERKDGYVEYERKYQDSAGRDVKAEGVAWRGPGGQIYSAGVADTKYWGDVGYGRTAGRYGRAAAAYGPYGGWLYTSVPPGGQRVTWYGRSVYYSGYYYYYPYYWAGAYYYYPWYPPYGAYYSGLPTGCITINLAGGNYYSHDHVYYKETVKEGKVAYEVVAAPSGAKVTELPAGQATITVGDQKFHYYHNTFYRRVQQNDQWVFVVIEQPAGIATLEKLPADFEPVPVDEVTYFKADDKFYLPYLNKEQEVYLLVDQPNAPKVDPAAAQKPAAASSAPLQAALTLPEGTSIAVRTAGDLSSDENSTGDHYVAYLESDLKLGDVIVVSRGSRVHGRLVDVEKGGTVSGKSVLKLELTDIVVNEQILPISTIPYEVDGKSAATLKQIGGSAGVGALIGAVAGGGKGAAIGAAVGAGAGTALAAATPGEQVKIPAQTLLDFELDRPLTVRATTAQSE